MIFPQTAAVVNDTTENPISGEYGSSTEGELQLFADGHSLVIGGYDVNAAQFDTGGAPVDGTTALAQTYTVATGGYTLVPRVVADIDAAGTVDTSTALLGVFNTNNIRSIATVDGSSFYLSGQGVSGDTTQGLFLAPTAPRPPPPSTPRPTPAASRSSTACCTCRATASSPRAPAPRTSPNTARPCPRRPPSRPCCPASARP